MSEWVIYWKTSNLPGLGISSFAHRSFAGLGICSFAHCSFAGLGICSFDHCSFAHFAQIKWATGSNLLSRLRQMSIRKRSIQVAQRKWATVSKLLRTHKTNEQFAQVLRGNKQMNNSLKKCWLKNLKSCFTMFYFRFLKK